METPVFGGQTTFSSSNNPSTAGASANPSSFGGSYTAGGNGLGGNGPGGAGIGSTGPGSTGGVVTVGNAGGGIAGNLSVPICAGIPAPNPTDCIGEIVQARAWPVDLIILLDRSVSNSYAVGSESARPAAAGELTRWDVLTAGLQSFVQSTAAHGIAVSTTFFGLNGRSDVAGNCDSANYANPVVPLGPVDVIGSRIVEAMSSVMPSGLTPTVPALSGTFQYAMSEKRKDVSHDKVVVLVSDGFPTLCDAKAPSDVSGIIAEAATAPIPIRTFVIGVGSPSTLEAAKFNLQNYARSGNTGSGPFILDETLGAVGVQQQLASSLVDIATSSTQCDYQISKPIGDTGVVPRQISASYQPLLGSKQEIPRVGGVSTCSRSANGGWYFDDILNPTKISLCPCTCSALGNASLSLVHGCSPSLVIE